MKMKKNKNAQIGWDHIIKLVIGLLMLLALIFLAINAKGGIGNLLQSIGDLFI